MSQTRITFVDEAATTRLTISPIGLQGVPGEGAVLDVQDSVADFASLPAVADHENEFWLTEDTGAIWYSNGATWVEVAFAGGAGETDLAVANKTATTFDVTSSTGTDATLPAATTTEAGLMAAADKLKVHDAVTVSDSTSIDLTLTGQQLSAAAIFGTDAGTVAQGNHTHSIYVPLTVLTDSEDPTGFLNPESIDVAYNAPTFPGPGPARAIVLTGTLEYYWHGVKHTLTSPWTSDQHASGDGTFYLYSTDGATFAWSTSPWSFEHIQVARVTVADSGATVFAQREPHGIMPFSTHQALHSNIGTWRKSGLTLDPATYTVNTASDAATTPGFIVGVVIDEDLETTIPAWPEGTYTTVRIGAASAAVFDVAASFPFRSSGSFILVNNPTTGAETATVNNRYVNVYQLVVPVTSDSDSQKYRMLMLQPQVAHTTLAAAQAEDPRGLALGSLTSLASELVFHARITYVTATGDANTGKCRIATGGVTYISGGRASQVSISGYTAPTAASVSVAATPSNYTAATPDVEAHLAGVDAVLASAHAAVTLVGTPDYLTITGQEITRNAVDLAADVTGMLPVANGGTGGTALPKLDDLAAPDDNTDLNATTLVHGLLPKLGGGTTNFLRADGTWAAAGGGSPGGSDTQIQFNDGGAFGGDSDLTWNKTDNVLTLAGAKITGESNVVELVNGSTAEALRVYNTKTSGTDYERGYFRWNANALELGVEKGGSGTLRKFILSANIGNLGVGILSSQGGLYGAYGGGTSAWEVRGGIDLSTSYVILTAPLGVLFGAGTNTSGAISYGTTAVTFGPCAASFTQLTHVLKPTAKDWGGGYTGAGHHLVISAGQGSSAAANNGGNLYIRGGLKTSTGTDGTVTIGDAQTSGIAFFNATPAAQIAHVTDASTTHAITDPADSPADADALREDLVTNVIPSIETALNNLGTKINNLLTMAETFGFHATS